MFNKIFASISAMKDKSKEIIYQRKDAGKTYPYYHGKKRKG
jgi:hypothetical protein